VLVGIGEENTLFGPKFKLSKLSIIIGYEIRPTRIAERVKGGLVRLLAKEMKEGSIIVDDP
jgi:hypothetical protein